MCRRIAIAALVVVVALVLWTAFLMHVPARRSAFYPFPADRQCAISVTDDTDYFQFATVDPVYALVDSLGLRLTKTVWVFDAPDADPASVGLSLENADYRSWVEEEAARGHEITLHTASSRSDERERMLEAYAILEEMTGERPKLEIFHSYNREAFYWGSDRLPGPVLKLLYGITHRGSFEGATEGSPYYWVDIARSLVRYVRTYTTNDINTLALNPSMPYEDPSTPMAPLWFASSNGRVGEQFARLFSEENVERLKRERGVSIVYAHFGAAFVEERPGRGRALRRDVREVLLRCGNDAAIAFVPAGEILDRLRVIQIFEDAVERGDRTVGLPRDLTYALDAISVDPAALHGPYSLTLGGAERVSLREWWGAVGLEVHAGDVSVFDGARRIAWRERWRMVLRWLATQVATPTG